MQAALEEARGGLTQKLEGEAMASAGADDASPLGVLPADEFAARATGAGLGGGEPGGSAWKATGARDPLDDFLGEILPPSMAGEFAELSAAASASAGAAAGASSGVGAPDFSADILQPGGGDEDDVFDLDGGGDIDLSVLAGDDGSDGDDSDGDE